MPRTHHMDIPVTIGDGEVMAAVEYTYSPGRPAVMYQRNGDPGWPADPPEVEVLTVKVAGEFVPQWFADAASDHLHEWLHENHDEPGPDPDAKNDGP